MVLVIVIGAVILLLVEIIDCSVYGQNVGQWWVLFSACAATAAAGVVVVVVS
jgi:hypothetical protein